MRTIISKLLAQEGLTVRTAHNGQVGLETACEYRPDLILRRARVRTSLVTVCAVRYTGTAFD